MVSAIALSLAFFYAASLTNPFLFPKYWACLPQLAGIFEAAAVHLFFSILKAPNCFLIFYTLIMTACVGIIIFERFNK
jgi:hypothetical protein